MPTVRKTFMIILLYLGIMLKLGHVYFRIINKSTATTRTTARNVSAKNYKTKIGNQLSTLMTLTMLGKK